MKSAITTVVAAAAALALAACDGNESSRVVGQLASDRIELSAEFAEPVVHRHVAEGEHVAAGTLLIEQDDARIAARLREAEAQVGQFEARLDELLRGPRREQIAAARASVEGAERELEFRRVEFRRAREVFEKNLGSPDTVDRAQASLDAAEARLAVEAARLDELLEGTTVEELRQAEQQLAQAAARVAQLAIDRERHRQHAPVAGIVDTLLVEPGERPQPGTPLLVMLPGAQPYARVYVPEALRVRITPGTAATVYVDGLAQPLRGRVRWVSSEAAFTPYFALTEHDRGRIAFAAKIDLDYDGARLPDGVPVEVEFDLPRDAG